jgi:flagellar FliL protein
MKSFFLVVMAIVVLGGGAFGAYIYFEQPAEASIGDIAEHQEAGETGPDIVDAKKRSKHEFVELSPLVLPIVDSNGVSQVISIVVVIEVKGGTNQTLVLNLQPRLKDAYIQELYGVLNKHAALKGGVVQVDVIKKRLSAISEKVLGEGVIEDVLLQVVQQRPI